MTYSCLHNSNHVRYHHFENTDEIICAVEQFLEDQDATFFRDGLAMFEHLRANCIDAMGTIMKNSKNEFPVYKTFCVRFEQSLYI